MAIELLALSITIVLFVTLAILYTIFDTISRVKGKFNKGWNVLFVAMLMLFLVELIELLDVLNYLEGYVFAEILETIFILVILFSVLIINNKVKEVHDGIKKKK